VDLEKIRLSKSVNGKQKYIKLKEIKQEGINIEKIIKENNLDGEFPYGVRVNGIRQAYNGKGMYAITKQEKKLAKKLGLVLEKKESVVAKTLKVAQILEKNRVDLRKIQLSKKINSKQIYILLREIKQEGIDIKKIIEENGLDGEFPYGSRINSIRQACNGR